MAETQHGFLVLADISGFTAFVTATELEHGPPIIAELLEEVMRRISPPLDVENVEGDAVFALGLHGKKRSWRRTWAAVCRPRGRR